MASESGRWKYPNCLTDGMLRVRAHVGYNLAASRTSGEDQKNMSELRDAIAAKMTAAQIAEAQRLAREWKPQAQE